MRYWTLLTGGTASATRTVCFCEDCVLRYKEKAFFQRKRPGPPPLVNHLRFLSKAKTNTLQSIPQINALKSTLEDASGVGFGGYVLGDGLALAFRLVFGLL